MDKYQVAAILDEIGTLLEFQGENSFRCNAYHNAARAIEQLEEDLADRRPRGSARRDSRHRRHAPRKNHHARHHRQTALLRRPAQENAGRPARHAAHSGAGTEERQGPLRSARHRHDRQAGGGLRSGRVAELKGLRRQDAAEDPRRALSSCARWGARPHRSSVAAGARAARRAARCARHHPHGAVRQFAAAQGNHQGHRHPHQLRRSRSRSWSASCRCPAWSR